MEQLDRQVLWILKAVPELLNEEMEKEADEHRVKIVFKSQMTSFHIFCFYKVFISEVCEKRNSRKAMWEEYNGNLCKLTNKEENEFQKRLFHIQDKIKSFEDFFEFTGLPSKSDKEVRQMLKDAIKNSERKKYHGEFEVIHELPKSEEQFKKLLENVPTYKKFFDIKSNQEGEGEKKTFKFDIK